MAIVDKSIQPPGLTAAVLNVVYPYFFGPAKASAIAAVFTKGGFASTINATSAVGTQPDLGRNLIYQMSMTGGTASSGAISAGSVIVQGFDMQGRSVIETMALSSLAAQSVSVQGSVIFASLASNGISLANVSLATASSSNSGSISLSIGVGNVLGLPIAMATLGSVSTNNANPSGVPYMYLGTSLFTNYTVIPGAIGFAGVQCGPTLGSGTTVWGMLDWANGSTNV